MHACASCHEISFEFPPPPGLTLHSGGTLEDNSVCGFCHPPSGGLAGIEDSHLTPNATPNNPLDYTLGAWNRGDTQTAIFTTLAQGAVDSAAMIMECPPYTYEGPLFEGTKVALDALIESVRVSGKPGAMISQLPENQASDVRDYLAASGVAADMPPDTARTQIAMHRPQRQVRKKLQAAPILAASSGVRAARKRWKSCSCWGPPALFNSPFVTQMMTSSPNMWYAASTSAPESVQGGTSSNQPAGICWAKADVS